MSLTSALNAAATGLSANTRAISTTSANIANAQTDGYARRELVTSSNPATGGVRIDGILRHSDAVLLHDRRVAAGQAAAADLAAMHARRIGSAFGSPEDPSSLVARFAAFEGSLVTAASDPSSDLRLASVAQAAEALAGTFNMLSDTIAAQRRLADTAISEMVDTLNTALARVADINTRISGLTHSGSDFAALQDQRQAELDRVAEIVPIRVIPADRNTVTVQSLGGMVLVDHTAVAFDFRRSNQIEAHMTGDNGLLSRLTIQGRDFDILSDTRLDGGSLRAAFVARDRTLTDAQARIDGLAADLANRFGPGGADPSLGPGQAGLFTDAGTWADPSQAVGLAGRLKVNTQVAPGSATLWKLRDGLSASTPGPAGNAGLLNDMANILTAARPAPTPAFSGSASLMQRVSDSATAADLARVRTESEQTHFGQRLAALTEEELALGVDTDTELQNLLKLEQAYAANAQVIRVVDDLFNLLLQR